MKTCETCKHWNDIRNSLGEPFGRCEKIGDYTSGPDAPAQAYGYYGDDGVFKTKPDFGCSLWEKKE